jgi:FtsZ-binding cell division protein ZapB
MMRTWNIFFRIIILIIGAIAIAFDVLLYNFCEKQRIKNDNISQQQQIVEQQIKGLNDSYVQQKDALTGQKDALLQEVEKRQQIEDENKSIQTSLVDIKAEADAIKQDTKGWQKDYVSVLAELEKKMDDSRDELKSAIEKITQPRDNSTSATIPVPDKNIERSPSGSQ